MAALAGALFLLAWLLDALWPLHAQTQDAAVFSVIWAGIQIVWHALETAGSAIALSLEGVVAYLVTALGWLVKVVGNFLVSTGAIFAKVWEGLKVVWTNVLKPALVWIDKQLTRLHDWLKQTFKPVFDFLARVRDELQAIYKRFVRPIIDTIEFIRAINRVLLTFHIHFLEALDRVLQQVEQRIEEPILWINAKLNEIWNVLELVVDAGGLFQRVTLIKSLARYAPAWMNGFWNAQIPRGLQSGDEYSRGRIYPLDAPWANGKELGQFYRGESNRMEGKIAELLPLWRLAAGVDPPTGEY